MATRSRRDTDAMKRGFTLVLGLGGTGVRVASRLKAFAAGSGVDSSSLRILAIGQDQDWPLQDEPEALSLTRNECFRLSGEAARTIGRHAANWQPHLSWLRSPGLRQLDEISAGGAGEQRWLGRLGFFAADREIQDAIRTSLTFGGRHPRGIMLVCAAGGGTGSGLLADITYLLERVAKGVPRLLYLLLPSVTDRERTLANSYAVLRELFHLKYQTVGFQAKYLHIGDLDVPAHSCEAWSRIYLFRRSISERLRFDRTVDRMVFSLAAQLEVRLYGEALAEAQREVALGEVDREFEGRESRCFSTCGAFLKGELPGQIPVSRSGVQTEIPGEPNPADPAQQPLTNGLGPTAAQKKRLYEVQVGRAISAAVDRLVADVEERTLQLPEISREAKPEGLQKVAEEVGALARIVDTSEPRQAPILDALNSWPAAWQEVQRGGQEYLANFSAEEVEQGEPARIAEEARAERNSTEGILLTREPGYADLLARWKVLLAQGSEGRGSPHQQQIGIEDCCNALRALVRRPEFRADLERFLESRIDLGAKSQTAESNPKKSESKVQPEPAVVEKQSDDADLPNREIPGWKDVVDSVLHQCSAEGEAVFVARTPQESRRAFAIALLPESLAHEGGETLKYYLIRRVGETLHCDCRIIQVQEDRFWLYYEDLYHSPCNIVDLEEYRKAYDRERDREKLHIDVRFLAEPLFTELCKETKEDKTVLCGNPGCRGSVSDVPPGTTLCPVCKRPIRSRCGNSGCMETQLHLHPEGQAKSCPGCHELNHGAWWQCGSHGKIETLVSNDHAVCPECVARHEADPGKHPVSSIGVRPDLRQTMPW